MAQSSNAQKLNNMEPNSFLNSFNNTPAPIWDVNNFDKSRYKGSEFTNYAWKSNEEADSPSECTDRSLETMITDCPKYICTLCNINVPTTHRKEHNDSLKHKVSVRIAEIALSRVTGAIKAVDNDSENVKTKGTYFCEACSDVFNENEQSKHELTEDHHKSMMHDKFLNDLLMIYEDINYLDTVDFNYLTMDFCKKENVTNQDSENETIAKYKKDKSNIKNPDKNGPDIENDGNNNEINIDADVNNTINNESKVGEDDLTKEKDYNLKIDDKSNIILVTTPEKHILELSFDNYNALFTTDKETAREQIVCRACGVIVRETKDKHVLTVTHEKKMSIPFENMHCCRRIDSTFNHCVLCNEIFLSASHICLKTHVINLVRAIRLPPAIELNFDRSNLIDILTDLVQTHLVPTKYYPFGNITNKIYNDLTRNIYQPVIKPFLAKTNFLPANARNAFVKVRNEMNYCNVEKNLAKPKFRTAKKNLNTAKMNNKVDKKINDEFEHFKKVNTYRLSNEANTNTRCNYISVLKTFCETCNAEIPTRGLPGHFKSEQHKAAVEMMRKPKPGITSEVISKAVTKYLGVVESNLMGVEINLGAASDSGLVDMETSLDSVHRICAQVDRIVALMKRKTV